MIYYKFYIIMDNLLENLNPEQLKAVTHKDGPLLIVAGAGTGKTTVIAQRIAYLIEQGRARPEEILALTFTEKAAGEMEERVDRLLPMGYLDLWISTFHGFGERIIGAHGLDIGLPAGARLLNEFEQWALIRKNLDKFELDYYRPLGNPTKFIGALVRHFSRLKDEDISPADYLVYAEELRQNLDQMLSGSKGKRIKKQDSDKKKQDTRNKIQENSKSQTSNSKQITNLSNADGEATKEILEQEILRISEVANAYHVYQQLLLDNDAIDFGDLINYTLKLFRERAAILDNYRRQFKYILVDEFQDTNWAQYELIKLLAAPQDNLVVVGDDDQSVYKFRGASISNIMQFKKDFPRAKDIVLTKNYRNRQNILDLSYEFIQLNNPNRLEFTLNEQKTQKKADRQILSKKLEAQVEGEGMIEVIRGEDNQDEIRQVVEKIADLKIKDKKASWNDFAILVRANDSAKEICSFLDSAGLPYIYLASRGLYTKPVIMDVIAYLKLLDDYHESPAVFRILNMPLFGFTPQDLVNFNYWAKKKTWSLYEVLKSIREFRLGEELVAKVSRVLDLVARHSALARGKSATEVVIAFLADSGYLKYLGGLEERAAQEQTGYLNKFIKRVAAFESASDDKSVKAFLAELNFEIEAGEQGSISPDPDSGPEAIKVMTVHAAKGLEFAYVFLAGLVDKRFPTIERKEAIEIPDALVKEILPAGDIHLEEERRLFYVAMTRAKKGLFLSWAPDYGGMRKKKPSRFLVESGLQMDDSGGYKQVSLFPLSDSRSPLSENVKGAQKPEYKLPSFFSYTQLAAFRNCPYQYRFAHILKIPRYGRASLSYGQTMHLTLQRLFQLIMERKSFEQGSLLGAYAKSAKQPSGTARGGRQDAPKDKDGNSGANGPEAIISLEEVLKIYEEAWIDSWYETKKQKEEYRQLGKKSLQAFYAKYSENWPVTVSLEQGLNLKLGGYRIFGKIDRIDDLGEDGIRIVDYKTGNPKSEGKITLEDKEQLMIYQMAARQAMNRPIADLQFYYLNDNSEINFVGSDRDLTAMEKKIIKNIEAIEAAFTDGVFPPKPGPLCRYCDFFDICEYRQG